MLVADFNPCALDSPKMSKSKRHGVRTCKYIKKCAAHGALSYDRSDCAPIWPAQHGMNNAYERLDVSHGALCQALPCRRKKRYEEKIMLIQIGYDIELAITAPMAVIYLLHVHPSRQNDLLQPDSVEISPPFNAEEYVDSFGNTCGRINVPEGVGSVKFSSRTQIRDSGLLDAAPQNTFQHDPRELPVATLQFLLPSR